MPAFLCHLAAAELHHVVASRAWIVTPAACAASDDGAGGGTERLGNSTPGAAIGGAAEVPMTTPSTTCRWRWLTACVASDDGAGGGTLAGASPTSGAAACGTEPDRGDPIPGAAGNGATAQEGASGGVATTAEDAGVGGGAADGAEVPMAMLPPSDTGRATARGSALDAGGNPTLGAATSNGTAAGVSLAMLPPPSGTGRTTSGGLSGLLVGGAAGAARGGFLPPSTRASPWASAQAVDAGAASAGGASAGCSAVAVAG